jgi:hypothetical protein
MPGDNNPPDQVRADAVATGDGCCDGDVGGGGGDSEAIVQGLVLDFISGTSVSCHRLFARQLQTGSSIYVYAVAATIVVMNAGEV